MKPLIHIVIIISLALTLASCVQGSDNIGRATYDMTGGGHATKGPAAMRVYGCGACHTIPGVSGAYGLVGPSLDRVGNRMFIAGVLANTPDNLLKWLKDPPAVDSMTAMPNMHITDRDAKDIAAYLYTLR
jgi:cytochrome c